MENSLQHQTWTKGNKFLFRTAFLFVLLFTISFSEPMVYIPNIRVWTDSYFEQLVLWSAAYIFNIKTTFTQQLTSDSTGAFIHVFNMLVLATLGSVIWGYWHKKMNYDKAFYWFTVIVSYYLALQLFLYGFNKIFKCQFFLPEPNTLYTSVGETPRDLLFWSLMGSSYGYTVFGGALELLAGGLLLFKKTRLLGALMSFGVLSNVVAINFGFNISVKLYSSFFLLLSFMLIFPYRKQLYAFFIEQKILVQKHWQPSYPNQGKRMAYAFVKILVIWVMLFEGLGPYFAANNFNDDLQARPAFHGAYEVSSYIEDGMPFPPVVGYDFRWKRAFVHRRGYFIVQNMDDKMQDYHFRYDSEAQVFLLTHTTTKETYYLEYEQPTTACLLLEGEIDQHHVQIRLEQLDLKQLSLLQHEFHWTIDAIKLVKN